METLQASILSAIKATRSSKKRADELTVYKFVKREPQSISNEEITDTLRKLCEEISSYFLIDNFSIVDCQPHIPTTMATPIIEKNLSAEILPHTVEDEIDSFHVENNDIDSSETLDLIDSTYKNIKYKKIKDNLLQDIKNDVSELIQNEIKQKLDLHNKEEY